MNIRVLLADDHRLVREALRETLSRENDIEVVGEAGNGADTIAQVGTLKPDVLVLDIGLPDFNGIEVATRLRKAGWATCIVALSAYTDKRFVVEMLRAGASAYVTKAAAGTELLHAIRAVVGGQSYFSPDIAAGLVSEVLDSTADAKSRRLAPREREVLRLVAEGKRSNEIAEMLHISPATVEVHRRNIMRKLGMNTVAELTRHAVREGIVPP
jgi:two-component system NarL family response regulator